MSKIMDAMSLVSDLHKTHGIVQRGGKKYTQVVHRMQAFRTVFGLECGVETEILVDDGQRVVVRAIIRNVDGSIVGSGMAEEIRGQGNVNKTSALENCETSALGRALASIGLSGGEYASANEMEAVTRKQSELEHQNQAAIPASDPSTPAVPPQAESPPDPTPEQQESPKTTQDRKDEEYYKHVSRNLSDMKTLEDVRLMFALQKPRVLEIKQRNAERAQLFLKLFQQHEARLAS